MIEELNSLRLAHRFIEAHVKEGDFCIDATAGRGRDTAFLCSLVGEKGRVTAFDIQKDAVEATSARLLEHGFSKRATVVHDGHQNMDKYVKEGSVDCVVFNFGYLPGGDHAIYTRGETSIEAITKALELIRPGGIVSLCIYYGGHSGFEEKEALMEFISTIDYRRFTVITHEFINRPNCPPIVVDIEKHKS